MMTIELPSMMTDDIVVQVLAAVCISTAVVLFVLAAIPAKSAGHSRNWRISSAKKAIARVRSLPSEPVQLAYLRRVDPFVFEEMILMALAEQGHKTKRNFRYTGDGGVDGRAVIGGHKTYIQAKRYSEHISAAHIAEFAQVCRKSGWRGLFVHTGRTGKLAKATAREAGIDIVSGKRLLDLVTGTGFDHRFTSPKAEKRVAA